MKRRRTVRALLVASLAAAVLPWAPPAHACAAETIPLQTFKVSVEPRSKTVEVGKSAVIHVTVVRPADQDPLGLGVPMPVSDKRPAEGVEVGLGVRVGDVYLFGAGMTDAEGKAVIKVRIKSYARPGTASVDAYAKKIVADTSCGTVLENGFTSVTDAFKVAK